MLKAEMLHLTYAIIGKTADLDSSPTQSLTSSAGRGGTKDQNAAFSLHDVSKHINGKLSGRSEKIYKIETNGILISLRRFKLDLQGDYSHWSHSFKLFCLQTYPVLCDRLFLNQMWLYKDFPVCLGFFLLIFIIC